MAIYESQEGIRHSLIAKVIIFIKECFVPFLFSLLVIDFIEKKMKINALYYRNQVSCHYFGLKKIVLRFFGPTSMIQLYMFNITTCREKRRKSRKKFGHFLSVHRTHCVELNLPFHIVNGNGMLCIHNCIQSSCIENGRGSLTFPTRKIYKMNMISL